MQRRTFLFFAALAPLGIFASRYFRAVLATGLPLSAEEMDRLAANIRIPAHARSFVDAVANIFAKDLPLRALTGSLRYRVAEAEFATI